MAFIETPQIRRAELNDARGIHEAHMRSIQEICSKNYNAHQITAWGQREFDESLRISHIKNDYVWVVTLGIRIEGYAHMRRVVSDDTIFSYIYGLYLTAQVSGKGIGSRLMQEMEKLARSFGATCIKLDSTTNAKHFYESFGFRASSEMEFTEINGVNIESFPMLKILI